LLGSRQKCAVSTSDIQKPQSTRVGPAVGTAGPQIAVKVTRHFGIYPFEVEVPCGIPIPLIDLTDAFVSVNDVEKGMTTPPATRYTIAAEFKEEFRIVQATGPASLPAHDS